MTWLTSGSQRLKANLNRSFGARKSKKAAAAGKKDIVGYKTVISTSKSANRSGIANGEVKKMHGRNSQPDISTSGCRILSSLHRPNNVTADDHSHILHNNIEHQVRTGRQAPHVGRRKEESIRNRIKIKSSTCTIQNHVVAQNQSQTELFHADSIERIVALQEQREIEQSQKARLGSQAHVPFYDDTQPEEEIPPRGRSVLGFKDANQYCRKEQHLHQPQVALNNVQRQATSGGGQSASHTAVKIDLPIKVLPSVIDINYELPRHKLRYFSNGVEVDMDRIPLPAHLDH